MTTTKEMIAVMQAFEDGKPIEVANSASNFENAGECAWQATPVPSWDWLSYVYRVALTKPSWDWSHVSDEINFLVRQSPALSGVPMGSSHRPHKGHLFWQSKEGRACYVECFASYDPGTCNWQDSLVVRPGYEETDQ